MGKYGKREIVAIDYWTNKRLKNFESITKASQDLKLDRVSIQRCLSGEYNHTHGYTFMYL